MRVINMAQKYIPLSALPPAISYSDLAETIS